MPFDHGKEKDKAIAWFNKVYNDVRDNIPEERIFEFSVKDGYAPLCKFLNVPIPMVKDKETGEMVVAPFPHVNDRASFNAHNSQVLHKRLEAANDRLLTMICKTITLAAVGYGGYVLWKTRLSGRL
jgi:hypothetical protein